MRRASLLITQVQRATENERVGSTDGISLEEYYQYLTDGARWIQSKILATGSTRFRQEAEWDADGNESYSLVSKAFDLIGPESIVSLEYSSSGNDEDYRIVRKATQFERWSSSGVPFQYIPQGRTIKVNAYPSSGSFRMVYDGLHPAIDKRRAAVSSATVANGAITALALNTASPYTAADYDLADHLTIVGWDGSIKMRGIPYTGVSSGTVSIQGGTYTYPSGSTTPTSSHYACLGEYATTHAQLDDVWEGVLILYCAKRILMRDESGAVVENDAELNNLAASFLEGYEPKDIAEPAIVSDDWGDLS